MALHESRLLRSSVAAVALATSITLGARVAMNEKADSLDALLLIPAALVLARSPFDVQREWNERIRYRQLLYGPHEVRPAALPHPSEFAKDLGYKALGQATWITIGASTSYFLK